MSNSEIVYEWQGPPHLKLSRRIMQLPSGFEYLGHELQANPGRDGAVVVGERRNALLFVEHYRPLVDATLLELPRGFGDEADPDIAYTAAREFREETGLILLQPQTLGRYFTDTGIYPAPVTVVYGQVPSDAAPAPGEEVTGVCWVARASIPEMIAAGEFQDGHTLSALALLLTSQK